MSKPRPQLYVFLDQLCNALRSIGKPDLADDIRATYKKGRAFDQPALISLIIDALDDSDQLEFAFMLEAA